MATNTYVALDTKTVETATSYIEFLSIPQGYTDLRLVVTGQTSNTSGYFNIYLNGDSTNTWYSRTLMYGDGTSAISNRSSNQSYGLQLNCAPSSANINSWPVFVDFMSYSNTNVYKTSLVRDGSASVLTEASVWLYRSTGAITSLKIQANATTWAVGSTFTLYGVASALPTAKATGGTITYDVAYTYHTFTASGTFTPSQALTCDVLMIAGGGGGGGEFGGGGGAGGVLYTPGVSVSASAQSVTVGAGGAGVATGQSAKGIDSTFLTYTALGGGNGAGNSNTYAARIGGSGGGGSRSGVGAAGTSGQGFAGGNSTADTNGAGGGGAGAAGANASTTSVGSVGGAGTYAYASWAAITSTGVSNYYAGGGGGAGYAGVGQSGGAGGIGGGGQGSGTYSAGAGGDAIANTGGGGGGGSYSSGTNYKGGNGASGLVIIRYPN